MLVLSKLPDRNRGIIYAEDLTKLKDEFGQGKIIIFKKGKNKQLKNHILIDQKDIKVIESRDFISVNPEELMSKVSYIRRNAKRDKNYILDIVEEYRRGKEQ